MTEEQEHRKPGPEAILENPVKLSTNITKSHYDRLTVYCRQHKISKAEAIRRAIDKLIEDNSK